MKAAARPEGSELKESGIGTNERERESRPMRDESLAFLRELLEAPSPSGYEQPVQEIWRRRTAPLVDRVHRDLHGNVIAAIQPDREPRLLLAGHCDELGFLVQHVADEGFIYFSAVGGHDVGIVPGRRVVIHAAGGPIPGVIGKRAIHLMTQEERKKVPELHEIWIDIGAASREEALSLVRIGDPITYDQGFRALHGGLAVGRAFDDKAGAFVVSEVLRTVRESGNLSVGLYGVSTVQEEIGLRGATTSTFGVNPTVGIAIDVTHATDHPDTDKRKIGDIRLGRGPVICRGANVNPRVFDLLVATASEEQIPYQIEAAARGTGTDANAIQLSRGGVATGLIGLPLRYMHTPSEVISLSDLEHAARLLTGFSQRLGPETELTP